MASAKAQAIAEQQARESLREQLAIIRETQTQILLELAALTAAIQHLAAAQTPAQPEPVEPIETRARRARAE